MKTDVEPGRRVGWGGKSHVLARHGRATLCGKRTDAPPPTYLNDEAPLCARCGKRYAAECEQRERHAERFEAAQEKLRENRRGRFAVYRCTLCGTQHQAPGRGVPFCFAAGHVAEIEVLEVQGPAFDGDVREAA